MKLTIDDVLLNMDPSEVIGLALTACEVQADQLSDDRGAWDAWRSVATKLAALKARALELEPKRP